MTDAFVIGGGPAGSAFAITAAKAGMSVTLCEQTRSAHHKVCGEFLSAETRTLLAMLGVDIDDSECPSQAWLRLVAGCRLVESKLPFTGRSLSRKVLDELLLEKAWKAGATVLRGVQATRLDADEDRSGVTIKTSPGGYHRTDFAVLATGSSTVRGIGRRQVSSLVGFKIMLSLTAAARSELEDRVQLMGYDGGYQGILLVEDQLASLAWIVQGDRAKELGTDWKGHHDFLARQSEHTGDLLAGSVTDWEKPVTVSGLQFGFIRKNVISENVFPVGRQMAIIPSFTGDGIAVALATGIEAAQALSEGVTASEYQQKMRVKLSPQFRWARAVHPLFLRSWTRAIGLNVARVLPGIVPFVTNATRLRHLP